MLLLSGNEGASDNFQVVRHNVLDEEIVIMNKKLNFRIIKNN